MTENCHKGIFRFSLIEKKYNSHPNFFQSMPKMGGDDDKDKKEESAESKAEKEAAVSAV